MEEKDIGLSWVIQSVDDQNFDIVTDFSDKEFVSQYQNDLDKVNVRVLNVDAFTSSAGVTPEVQQEEV